MLAGGARGEHVVHPQRRGPFIFGRGGGEAEHMRAAGVAVEVVNSITAGMARPTALGVPLTHRDHAQGVLFITGHAARRRRPDWALLARTAQQALDSRSSSTWA